MHCGVGGGVSVVFPAPQPRGNRALDLQGPVLALFWRLGKFGVSCCCSKLPPSTKCSGMRGFCNQLLHQESSLNSPILPSSPPRCWLSQREDGRWGEGYSDFLSHGPDSACGHSSCRGSIPNTPREVLVPRGRQEEEPGSQSQAGEWGGGHARMDWPATPEPTLRSGRPCYGSAVPWGRRAGGRPCLCLVFPACRAPASACPCLAGVCVRTAPHF